MKVRIYIILMLIATSVSCKQDSKIEQEIAKVEINFEVERFDKAFFEAKPQDLKKLKNQYPFFFSSDPDSFWIEKMKDSLQRELLKEVQHVYPDFNTSKTEIQSLFQHLKYYDKSFSIPRVITLTNDVAYRDKTFVNDSIVLIALDNYLGAQHEFYQNIPMYIAENMKESQIVADVANGYATKYLFQSTKRTLLDEMIYHGKLLFFKDVMIPFKTDADKIGYSESQVKWAEANESQIWSYFIEKELLYSTDSKLPGRFISDAPFSKFYLELDNESPGRLGQYLGWQIVRAYAENTGDDIMKIMQLGSEEIFNKSKFKPKK